MSPAEWHRVVDVNIKGVLNTTAAVLPHMIKQRAGHILNTSWIAGRKIFNGNTVYCATKFAVSAFSDGSRMELGSKRNIRARASSPALWRPSCSSTSRTKTPPAPWRA